MPTAADEYVANLAFFTSLPTRTWKTKLEYDTATGRFGGGGYAIARSFGNWGKSSDQKQSVTNDAMFHDPVVSVFRAAREHRVPVDTLRNAYKGLASLRKEYTDTAKAASLQRTLVDILAFIPSALVEETRERFRTIDPDAILGPLDLSFMNTVWDQRAQLFELVEQGAAPDPINDRTERPYAALANTIYRMYNANAEDEIIDKETWAKSLPALMENETGPYYHLQHNKKKLRAAQAGKMATNVGYGKDFVYYTPDYRGQGQLWRIYLNFEADTAAAILNHLWNVAETYRIHSFKISGPHSFHTRVDKIVIYVQISHRDALVENLRGRAKDFRFKNPVPGMTRPVIPGMSVGVEPGSLDIGFSYARSLLPGELKRQSYGSIRCQLIAAALTQMHAMGEENPEWARDYRADKTAFLKWVAIAFEGYGRQLAGRN